MEDGKQESQLEQLAPSRELTRIGMADLRTDEEKVLGMPKFTNEGVLAVEIDRRAFADLLREEGLTPQQISALEITFKTPRFAESMDLHGAFIGGVSRGPQIEVFTSMPFVFHQEETPPEILGSSFVFYVSQVPKEEIVDSLLHEAKHYGQYAKGVSMANSWAAGSQEEHDSSPTEREAAEFAKIKSADFEGKIKVYDQGGHFKPVREIIGRSGFVTGIVKDEQRVARFWEDSPETNDAYDYARWYGKVLKGPTDLKEGELAQFLNKGRSLVERKVIAASEFNTIASRLAQKLEGINDLSGAMSCESAIIYGVV